MEEPDDNVEMGLPETVAVGTKGDSGTAGSDTSHDIEAVAKPRVATGEKIVIEDTSAPNGLCGCLKWHPTQAVVTVDGKKHNWNARNHRKLRFPEAADEPETCHPSGFFGGFRLFCWEPLIVTWYICWIGVIANTLWVVNGVYAVWPEQASKADPEIITFVTGVIGAFLFIVTGYLGYVEAINQSHTHIEVPTLDKKKGRRVFRRPSIHYGSWPNPLGLHKVRSDVVRAFGFPLLEDAESKELITNEIAERYIEENGTSKLIRRPLNIHIGKHVIDVTVNTVTAAADVDESFTDSRGYRWWTWEPDLHYIGIFNALVFFIATILFFIPAASWYPMDQNGATKGNVIFWNYVLQIIPSMGFVYVGHAAMAEAASSWVKPKFSSLGWWISFWNTIGGYGFLLYPILYLPSVVNEDKDYDDLNKWGASMATFWGSCAFWISGILQCIEFSSQHPIRFTGKKKKN